MGLSARCVPHKSGFLVDGQGMRRMSDVPSILCELTGRSGAILASAFTPADKGEDFAVQTALDSMSSEFAAALIQTANEPPRSQDVRRANSSIRPRPEGTQDRSPRPRYW